MLNKLEAEKVCGNSWRSKKRKRQFDSTMEVETKLKEYIGSLSSRFNEGEIKVYDLTPREKGALISKKESSPCLLYTSRCV